MENLCHPIVDNTIKLKKSFIRNKRKVKRLFKSCNKIKYEHIYNILYMHQVRIGVYRRDATPHPESSALRDK